jgi:hypothetical protein
MSLLRTGIAMALLHASSLKAPAAATAGPSSQSFPRTVAFAWDAPVDRSVTTYKIYWGTGNGNYQHVREIKAVATRVQTTKLSLATDTKYFVAVSACNFAGESRLSNQVIVPPIMGDG